MAEGKKSFVLYADLLNVVEKLILKDRSNGTNYAGELFYHILQYVNDANPIPIDFIVEMAFEPIKLQLKRDLKKYETIREKRAEAGRVSAEKRKQTPTNSTHVDTSKHCSTNLTVNDNDNGNVNDNVTTKVVLEEEVDFKKIVDGSFSEDPKYRSELDQNIETLKTYSSWKNDIAKQQNIIPISDVDIWIDKYKAHILTQPKTDISVNELRKHFSNWLKKRIVAGDKIQRPMTAQEKRQAISKAFNTN